MNTNSLNISGYVALSDPTGDFVVLVEPDGKVWIPDDTTLHFVPGRQCANIILHLKDDLKISELDSFKRSWQEGYLPILILESANRSERVMLCIKGKQLWVKHAIPGNNSTIYVFPENRSATNNEFEAVCNDICQWWKEWLKDIWTPPENSLVKREIVLSCLVQARCAYNETHPHYGVGFYGKPEHDGFPPTTISMVDCLLDYGLASEACNLLNYYYENYITPDGRYDYYGPSIAEYGQLLTLSSKCIHSDIGPLFYKPNKNKIINICNYILSLIKDSINTFPESDIRRGLIKGAPEADEAKYPEKHGYYFHNNAAVWQGLNHIIEAFRLMDLSEEIQKIEINTRRLENNLRRAINACKITIPGFGPIVTPQVGQLEYWPDYTSTREASYANYRYYPELLETGFLSSEDAMQIIKAREQFGGEKDGMTLFFTKTGQGNGPHLDDWTLASYGKGLLILDQHDRFLKILHNHTNQYMTQDTHTAYEQITLDSTHNGPYADFCVPVQLVTPRLLRWLHSKFDIEGY